MRTRELSVIPLWAASVPCSNHPPRMSVMRRPKGLSNDNYDGQRYALLTTKSRNT